jgi:DNA-3-methyladenine glycosylase
MPEMKIPLSYFRSNDVVALARDLLGKKVCTLLNGQYTSGIITETEAYRSWGDRACHAHLNRRTKRTEVMFGPGGVSYVYLCYGIHHLFNIVTNVENRAEAILIRAVEPLEGIEIMEERRGKEANDPKLSAGPGNASKALGITTTLNNEPLNGSRLWLEEHSRVSSHEINVSTRIGVDYAGKDALHPWRFYLKKSRFVSRR